MIIPNFVKTHLPESEELVSISNHIFGIKNNIEDQKTDEASKNKKMYMFSGLSGSGKDTIIDLLKKRNNKLTKIKTCTTRDRRPEESECDDPHIRVSIEQMHEMMKNGEALEFAEYAGNYYCTSKKEVEKCLDSENTPILRVDPQGSRFFLNAWKSKHPTFEDVTFVYLFIIPSSFQDLRDRLSIRGSDPEFIEKRILQSEKDIAYISDSQYVVINEFGKLDEVIEEVALIVN